MGATPTTKCTKVLRSIGEIQGKMYQRNTHYAMSLFFQHWGENRIIYFTAGRSVSWLSSEDLTTSRGIVFWSILATWAGGVGRQWMNFFTEVKDSACSALWLQCCMSLLGQRPRGEPYFLFEELWKKTSPWIPPAHPVIFAFSYCQLWPPRVIDSLSSKKNLDAFTDIEELPSG